MSRKKDGWTIEDAKEEAQEAMESVKGDKKKKEPTLEDVTPLHPNEYPAKHLKEKLDARRERLQEIEERSHPSGIPEGLGY